MNKIPSSPFATRLSGSATETELRIRSIFQWKKQRPPLWAMILTGLVILSCGGLVSCQAQEERPAPRQQTRGSLPPLRSGDSLFGRSDSG